MGAGEGWPWRNSRGLDAEKLSEAHKVVPWETYQFHREYNWHNFI
jgi:hypothetical protein